MPDQYQPKPDSPGDAGGGYSLFFILFLRELIVDVLAILVPGFWFVIACLPTLVVPVVWLMLIMDHFEGYRTQFFINDITSLLSGFHTELFISMLVTSYLVGHLMFRQDPKRPDRLSWIIVHNDAVDRDAFSTIVCVIFKNLDSVSRFILKLAGKGDSSAITHWTRADGRPIFDGMVRPRDYDSGNKRGPDQSVESVPVEYPYSNLKIYLTERGFTELAKYIEWKGDNDVVDGQRSKQFINNIKAWLEFYHPSKLRELIRIEAHIRLHSSLWYSCLYLQYASLVGLLVGITGNVVLKSNELSMNKTVIALPISVYFVCIFFQRLIEKAFHYQRMREIFYVLRFKQLSEEYLRTI